MGNTKSSIRSIKHTNSLPLIIEAARDGHRDKVHVYLKHKHDVNSTCHVGFSPLMAASAEGHVDVMTLLLKKGANIDHQCKAGHTALIAAAYKQQALGVQLLLQHGACVNLENREGVTALMAAVGNVVITELLLRHDASSVNRRNCYGQTALMMAVLMNNLAAVKILIQYGADKSLSDKWSRSPLMIATCSTKPDRELLNLLVPDEQQAIEPPTCDNETTNLIGGTQIEAATNGPITSGATTCIFTAHSPESSLQSGVHGPIPFPDLNTLMDSNSSHSDSSMSLGSQNIRCCSMPSLLEIDKHIDEQLVEVYKMRNSDQQKRIESLQRELQATHRKQERHKEEQEETIQQRNEQCAFLEDKIRMLETALRKHRQEWEEMKAQLNQEKSVSEQSTEHIFMLTQQNEQLRRDGAREKIELQGECQRLEIVIDNKDGEIESLRQHIEALSSNEVPYYENWKYILRGSATALKNGGDSASSLSYTGSDDTRLKSKDSAYEGSMSMDRRELRSTTNTYTMPPNQITPRSDPAAPSPIPHPLTITVNIHGDNQSLDRVSLPSLRSPATKPDRFQALFVELSKRIGKEYNFIGFHLGLDNITLERIKTDNPNDLRKTIYDMLLTWSYQQPATKSEQAVLDDLRTVLIKVDRRDIADELTVLQRNTCPN